MKILADTVCSLAILSLVSSGCASRVPKAPPSESVHIADVVDVIQKAIDPFWQAQPSGLPPISSVKLALQTVRDSRLSGEADYLVVAVKGYYDNAFTQEVDLTLVPQRRIAPLIAVPGPTIEKALRAAIESAQKQISATYTSGGHTLSTQQIDVQISFSVTWDASAGVNKWAIVPISFSGSEELSSKTVNTITVTFKTPAAAAP
jgi:hypothetical protein